MTARPGPPPRAVRGFTLFETVLVIGMLAAAAAVLMRMQPRIFSAQTAMRDEVVGIELQRACAERLLAVRRQSGYLTVSTSTCNALGGIGGFNANPTVTLRDDANNSVSTCATSTCTASITVPKTSGPAAALPALTLQLTNY